MKNFSARAAILSLCAFLNALQPADAQQVDSSFGTNGRVLTTYSNIDFTYDLLLQPDGKLVIGGTSLQSFANMDMTLVRYNSTGTIDNSFGQQGFAVQPFSPTLADEAAKLIIEPNGNIVAFGRMTPPGFGYDAWAIARFLPSGQPDASFGAAGKVVVPFSEPAYPGGILRLASGQYLLTGTASTPGPLGTSGCGVLARLKPNGTFDSTFGTAGLVFDDLTAGADHLYNIIPAPGGKYLVAADMCVPALTHTQMAVVRYHANGTRDTSFGIGGIAATSMTSFSDRATHVGIMPSGKILALGFGIPALNTNMDWTLVCYNANGTPDLSFGNNGSLMLGNPAGNDDVAGLHIYPNGTFLVAGSTRTANQAPGQVTLRRFLSNGAPDASFGTNGILLAGMGYDAWATSMVVQPDGKIVVGGSSNNSGSNAPRFAMIRFHDSSSSAGMEKKFAVEGTLQLHPNPASSWLTIPATGASTYRLFSTDGRLLREGAANTSTTTTVDIRDLPAGIYLLTLQGASNKQLHARFAKQ